MCSMRNLLAGLFIFIVGVLVGNLELNPVNAGESWPTEHKGVSVGKLGVIPRESMVKQTGLEGYVLQLRVASIAPGGQIARHKHDTRPGLVYTLEGTLIEGRPGREREFPANGEEAMLEDFMTDHWIYNRSDKPVKFLICDLDNR